MDAVLIARIILTIVGGFFIAFGVNYVISPADWLNFMPGGSPRPGWLTEVRATYGGGNLAVGACLLLSVYRADLLKPALWLALLYIGCTAAGRAIGLLVDGERHVFLLTMLGLEALGALICGLALYALSRAATLAAAKPRGEPLPGG